MTRAWQPALCAALVLVLGAQAEAGGVKVVLENQYADETGFHWLTSNAAGTLLLACTGDNQAAVLDAQTLKVLQRFPGAGDRAEFALGDKALVAGDTWQTQIQVIERASGQALDTIQGRGSFLCHGPSHVVAYSLGNDLVKVYDLAEQKLLATTRTHQRLGFPNLLALSKGGVLAINPWDGKTCLLWAPPYDKEPEAIGCGRYMKTLAFSPDGKALAVGTARYNRVDIWDVGSKSRVRELTGHAGDQGDITAVAFSPDGRFLASFSGLNTTGRAEVILWDTRDYKEAARVDAHKGLAGALTFLADGKRFATGGGVEDGTLKVWKIEGPD